MSDFTKEQKQTFLLLSKRYDSQVFEIASKGGDTQIEVSSEEEARLLDQFASRICDWVFKDFSDIDGDDEDINADAEMVTYMVSDILSESGFDIDMK